MDLFLSNLKYILISVVHSFKQTTTNFQKNFDLNFILTFTQMSITKVKFSLDLSNSSVSSALEFPSHFSSK